MPALLFLLLVFVGCEPVRMACTEPEPPPVDTTTHPALKCERVWNVARAESTWFCPDPRPPGSPNGDLEALPTEGPAC